MRRDRLEDRVLDLGGVHPEEPESRRSTEDLRDGDPFGMAANTAPGRLLPVDLAQDFHIHPARPVHQPEQRLRHSEQEADQRPRHEHAHSGHQGGDEVVSPHPQVAPDRREVHQPPDRVDHDGAENGDRER